MRSRSSRYTSMTAIAVVLLMSAPALAQDYFPENKSESVPKEPYSPYVDDHFPTRVFFGDTHLHTSWSTDAGLAGATLKLNRGLYPTPEIREM